MAFAQRYIENLTDEDPLFATSVCITAPCKGLIHRNYTRVILWDFTYRINRGFQTDSLDMSRKADALKKMDTVIVDINLVPGEPVTGRNRVGMMVVVPSLATGQQGHPQIVARVVAGRETP